jgi:hypothetical protein
MPDTHLLAVRQHFIVDGQQPDLLGADPQGEVASKIFYNNSEEALNGAEDGAVDHDRLCTFACVWNDYYVLMV